MARKPFRDTVVKTNPLASQFTTEKKYIICLPRVGPIGKNCDLELENAAISCMSFPSKLVVVDIILIDTRLVLLMLSTAISFLLDQNLYAQ